MGDRSGPRRGREEISDNIRHKGALTRNFVGAVETAIFMKSGTARFTQNARAMKLSFLVPVFCLLPLTLIMVSSVAGTFENAGIGTHIVLSAIYSLRLLVYLLVFPALVYLLARATDRLENFARFVTAHNWLSLPMACLILPAALMLANGSHAWLEIQPMVSLIMLYAAAYIGFMATYVMRLPWELAGFVAITGIAVHQTSLHVLKWMAIETVQLVSYIA